MNHIVTTIANGKILYMATVGDTLTLEGWKEVGTEMTDILQNSPNKMHVIIDMTDLKQYPRNAAKLIPITRWAKESNMQSLNHVTTDRFIQILGDVVITMLASQYKSTKTLDEALEHLLEDDDELTVSFDALKDEIMQHRD